MTTDTKTDKVYEGTQTVVTGCKLTRPRQYAVPLDRLQIHPLNERLYDHSVIEDLVQSIRDVGLLQPLVCDKDGNVLSGKRRLLALRVLNAETAEVQIQKFDDDDDLELFILEQNRHRRKTPRQYYNEAQAYRRLLGKKRQVPGQRTSEYIASRINCTSARHLERIEYVFNNAPQAIVEDLEAGRVTVGNAYEQARSIDKSPAPEVAKKNLDTGKAKTTAQAITQAKQETTKYVEPPKFVEAIEDSEKFGTLVIRPPIDLAEYGAQTPVPIPWYTQNYNPMTIQEVCDLQINGRYINDMMDDDAHIYLVLPPRAIVDAEQILQSYGFEFGTLMAWCRPNRHYGQFYSESMLPIIFGHRGEIEPQSEMRDYANWFNAAVPSDIMAMPQRFYEMVQICSPGPYVEIFTTSPKHEWTCHAMKGLQKK